MLALLLGIFVFWLSCWLRRRHKKFFKHAIIVPGYISSYTSHEEIDKEGSKRTVYEATVSFEFEGKPCTAPNSITGSSKPEIGTPVQVGVNPYNIEEVRINPRAEAVAIWVLMGIGLFLVILGIAGVCGKI